MADLTDKVVLVTGGSRGIGAEIVRAAAAAGAAVVLHYGESQDRAAALAREIGEARCRLVAKDLASPTEVGALWSEALAWRSRIDVLVNNAAIYEPAPIDADLETWHAAWARILQVNLQAPADLCRAAVRQFRDQGGGIIVNVASRAAYRGELPEYGHYAATKGGLISLTKTIARGFAADGVLAYCVSPGWTDTEMATEGVDDQTLAEALRGIPLGEMVPPVEVANAVIFFASGAARHATGSTIDLYGGSYMR